MRKDVRRYGGLLVRIAFLALTIAGSNLWLVQIRDSILGYRSVLRGQPRLGVATSPEVQQVVMVVVGGLRYDASLEMPYLNRLREIGVEAPSRGYFPSNSETAWTTLVSGAGPEINDAPLLDVAYEEIRLLTVDDLFTQVKRSDFTTALAGPHEWERMIPEHLLDRSFFVLQAGAEADRQVTGAALDFMRTLRPNFLLIHLSQVDYAGQNFGATSGQYQAAVRRVDSHLREIAQALSLTRCVLVVTADHGHLAEGGHGGGLQEVVITPFAMAGAHVVPGDHQEIHQADIAPTIATLLGVAVPSGSQGQILFDALVLDDGESTEKWVAWAQQRVELDGLYLESIGRGPLSDSARGDAEVAYSSLLVRNYDSARSLAGFAVEAADEETREGRAQRISDERRRRLPVALLAIAVPAYVLWRRWSRTTAFLILCALGTVLIYNLLFIQAAHAYSFSVVGSWEAFVAAATGRMLIALLPSLCILIWLIGREIPRRPADIAATDYSFGLILAYLLALPLMVGYVLNGSEVVWYLPDPLVGFAQVSALTQLPLAAFFCLLMPLVTVPLDRALRWVVLKARAVRPARA